MIIRGVLHVHSLYSYDGTLTLAQLREIFMARKLQFVCVTEHTDRLTPQSAAAFVKECETLSDHEFIFVPGFEVPHHDAHVLMFGCSQFVSQKADDEALLRTWAHQAQCVVLAHPHRNKFIASPTLEEVVMGVEIWNSQYDGKLVPRFESLKYLHRLRSKNHSLGAFGGLDFHRAEHVDGPIVEMEASSLTNEMIVNSLKNGNFSIVRNGICIDSKQQMEKLIRSAHYRTTSFLSIVIITVGKKVNAVLRKSGMRLPAGFRRVIRKYI